LLQFSADGVPFSWESSVVAPRGPTTRSSDGGQGDTPLIEQWCLRVTGGFFEGGVACLLLLLSLSMLIFFDTKSITTYCYYCCYCLWRWMQLCLQRLDWTHPNHDPIQELLLLKGCANGGVFLDTRTTITAAAIAIVAAFALSS
jgi:hypothetical protein